ncbi:MAG: 3'-5' exonuclease [Bacteroidetes bacterium]|nr:MAG: 3'-5' exonuclease [Bacteroidota bacterium]
MKQPRILFIDTETGGTNPQKHDLLSVGLAVWENGNIIARKEIPVQGRPERCTEEALAINRIDLEAHNRKALSRKEALSEIIRFIEQHFEERPVTVAGHNVAFDLNFLRALFEEFGEDMSHYLAHRTIDTASILQLLALLEGSASNLQEVASSSRAFAIYHIDIPAKERHTALGDAMATARLFSKILEKLKERHQPDPAPAASSHA